MDELRIHVSDGDESGIVRLSGDADLPSIPAIENLLRPLLEQGRAIVLDISQLEFCSYSFLSALDRLRSATADSGGSLYIAGATRWLRGVLRKVGMTSLLLTSNKPAPGADSMRR